MDGMTINIEQADLMKMIERLKCQNNEKSD